MDTIDFSTFLNDKLKSKGLSIKKLADVTGIPLPHLQHLSDGRYGSLPPAPYVRGYLSELGTVLGFDGNAAWDHFKTLHAPTSSGRSDALPANRFARRSTIRYAALIVAALALIGYITFRSAAIFGRPILIVAEPQEDIVRTDIADYRAHGTLTNGDTMFVNGEPIPVEGSGAWEKRVRLQPGLNSIEFAAKKFLGGETVVVRQIMYEMSNPAPSPTPSEFPIAPE